MERLTLTPQCQEIIVNNGSADGAVDLFSYGPETSADLRSLGGLYVIGHRDTDSSNMGYMVSLIAALARREYYAQPGQAPREAFTRTLKKVNEVVDEFFKSSGVSLSVGIFAIAGSGLFVSKLDKFKMLLAREGEVIDILNNVGLFQREHVEKRQFSNIISGSVQPGDRLVAYYPSKAITTRERNLKSYLLKLPYAELAAKLDEIGQEHASFATALLHVNMIQIAEPAVAEPVAPSEPEPVMPQAATQAHLAWTPRQHAGVHHLSEPEQTPEMDQEPEIPNIISSEFALGIRRSSLSRMLAKTRLVRLSGRTKAIILGGGALLIVGVSVVAAATLFTSPEERKLKSALNDVRGDITLADNKLAASDNGQARQILVRALTTLAGYDQGNGSVKELSASIVQKMDSLDNAEDATLTLVGQTDPDTDPLAMAMWASASNTTWVTTNSNESHAIARIQNGSLDNRTDIGSFNPSFILPFADGVLAIDATAKSILRIGSGAQKTFAIPTQDSILAGTTYEGGLYLLTDHAILKVSDLDTDKPVTKQWLTDVNDLASEATRIAVDGNIYTLSNDGTLTTYYKGKKSSQIKAAVEPSGSWSLVSGPAANQLAVANSDTKRIYIIDITSGELVRTLKVDVQGSLVSMGPGPDGSVVFITKDNKLWQAK